MTKKEIKQWVVKKSTVTNPYKKYWSASVTLDSDICASGTTIENAYVAITDKIFYSEFLKAKLILLTKSTFNDQQTKP